MRSLRLALAISAFVAGSLVLLHDELALLFTGGDVLSSRWVEDPSGLLSDAQRTSVARYHAALLDEHDIDYRMLTLTDGGDINWTAHAYFEAELVGERSTSGRGLLLVIDVVLDQVRLEVSTSLEGVYTDAFVAYVQNRQMVPYFNVDRVADGVLATTELIVARAQAAEAGAAFAPPMPSRSMGGGATAAAGIGAGTGPASVSDGQVQPAADLASLGPVQVVELYLGAMAERDSRDDLSFYSAGTRRMLQGWVVTAAQMDNVARTYRSCTVDDVHIRDGLAVVRYRIEQRQCAPYFLELEDGAWKLDLTMMSSSIRFNHENHWRFQTPRSHRYRFAFEDWRFDQNGFPLASRPATD